MAPEIILGKGYSYSSDLWSLGVVLFEFLCGELPYGEDLDNPYDINKEIDRSPIVFPSFVKDKDAKKLILQLLNKVPDARLGDSYASLKANRWFNDLDWV